MAEPRRKKALKHVTRDTGGNDNESLRTVIVLVVAIFLILAAVTLFISLANSEPAFVGLDYAKGHDDAFVTGQPLALRPFDEGMANYRPLFVNPGEPLGSLDVDPRNDSSPVKLESGEIGRSPFRTDKIAPITSQWPADADGIEDPTKSPKEIFNEKLAKVGGPLASGIYTQLNAVNALPHKPIIEVAPVSADQFPSPNVNLNLRRETANGERRPLPGADPKKGPFYFPTQLESPWLAFDHITKDVAALAPETISTGDNGEAFFEGEHPELVLNLRGRVFTVRGRLFMLREQPLRTGAYEFGGKKYEHAYFGIISYLKQDLLDQTWKHHNIGFTALEIPDEFKPYALKAGEKPDNADRLANETVNVSLTGVYFRRFCYTEEAAKLVVERSNPKPDASEEERTRIATFETEDYMPWFISQGLSTTELEPLSLAQIKSIVDEVDSDAQLSSSEIRRFDEAGYYLCLQALNDPSNPLADAVPKELVMRMLNDPKREAVYRGARAKAAGILREAMYPLMLRPNISGKRSIYRIFVTDALDPKQIDVLSQWYVDTIEPPVSFRGKPRVTVDGIYYRSQLFTTEQAGSFVQARVPLLLTRALRAYDPHEFPELNGQIDEDDSLTPIWIAGAVVLLLAIGILLLVKMDRRGRADFENDAMNYIRARLERARARVRGEKARTDDSEADPPKGDDGA